MKFNREIAKTQFSHIEKIWDEAAMKYSMEYGIHIEVEILTDFIFVKSIEFKIGDRTFGSLKELRRFLRLKAFL